MRTLLAVSWRANQTVAVISVVASGLVACFALGHLYWQAGPLALLLYMIHWKTQGRAYDLNAVKSEQIVSMLKMRGNRFDPDW